MPSYAGCGIFSFPAVAKPVALLFFVAAFSMVVCQDLLKFSLRLLQRLQRGPFDTSLKHERTIMCTLLCSSKWHKDLPGHAHSDRFGEGMLSKVVRDKANNTGSVNVQEVENHYLLLQVGLGGKRVGVQSVLDNLVQRMPQRLTRFFAADRICMAYVEW